MIRGELWNLFIEPIIASLKLFGSDRPNVT